MWNWAAFELEPIRVLALAAMPKHAQLRGRKRIVDPDVPNGSTAMPIKLTMKVAARHRFWQGVGSASVYFR